MFNVGRITRVIFQVEQVPQSPDCALTHALSTFVGRFALSIREGETEMSDPGQESFESL